MLRKVKKELPSSPVVVDSSSDSEIEYIKVYKDDTPVDVVLDNNRIMMDDMISLFPRFHGLHLVGSGINRMLPKSKFTKKKYFPPPEVGWAAVKINVLIMASSTSETPRSTPTIPEPSELKREQMMFRPPVHLPSLLSEFVPPPSIIPVSQCTRFVARPYFVNHIAPPALVTTTPLLEPQRRNWDARPTQVQLILPPVKTIPPSADSSNIIRVSIPSLSTPKEKTGRDKEVSSFQLAPVTSQRETINNNSEENSSNHIASSSPSVLRQNGKRKRQDTEDSEVPIPSTKKAPTDSQPSPSRPNQTKRAQRHVNVNSNGPRVSAAKPVNESEDESSDFEVIAHVNRPIKGEFGELTICRSPQIDEKVLLFHFKVKCLTELRMLVSMKPPCWIPDFDEFDRFRNFSFHHLRNILVQAAPSVERVAYVLFMASKSNVSFNVLQEGARKKCSTCKGDEFTLGHILSQKHLILYRDKYFCYPDEIMVMLKPENQNYYIGDDKLKYVLRQFKVQSFEALKMKPQFSRNRCYPGNASHFEALKKAFIQRLKLENLRIDPRVFWLEKMLFFKYEAENDTKLLPLLMDVFKGYQRKCYVCDTNITSWIEYMKHIISKAHIRKELTQAQMNLIVSAMRLIKNDGDGFAVLPEAEAKFKQKTKSSVSVDEGFNRRQRDYNVLSDDDSNAELPPDDPVNNKDDAPDRSKEIEHRLRFLSKHKKLTKPHLQEKQNFMIERSNWKM